VGSFPNAVTLPEAIDSHGFEAFDAELATERARRRLVDFTAYCDPTYRIESVHALIGATLDRVVRGELTRVIISAPPRFGKSHLATRHLPAFWLGRRPDDPIILASYAAGLAESMSRDARGVVESEAFQAVFPGITTDRASRAVSRWEIADQAGVVLAKGVGGGITGHGAALGVIDDPVEDWAEAQSATYRNRVWDWYRSTFLMRIHEAGAIVIIMTRWHDDDLVGRLLKQEAADWHVLRLPALAETQQERDENDRFLGLETGQPEPLGRKPGEPLALGRFSLATLESRRKTAGSLMWSALFQGVPRPLEGSMFKRDWLLEIAKLPTVKGEAGEPDTPERFVALVRYWDKAGTADGGDYTAGVLMGKTVRDQYIVVDCQRGQWSAHEREQRIKATAERDRDRFETVDTWIEQEPGSGGKESAESTVRNLAGHNVHSERATGEKHVRAQPFAAQCEAGNVSILRGAWAPAYTDELLAFPNGSHDDQVDGSSGAFNKLAESGGLGIYFGDD